MSLKKDSMSSNTRVLSSSVAYFRMSLEDGSMPIILTIIKKAEITVAIWYQWLKAWAMEP